jgi:hypothetical protein
VSPLYTRLSRVIYRRCFLFADPIFNLRCGSRRFWHQAVASRALIRPQQLPLYNSTTATITSTQHQRYLQSCYLLVASDST